MALNAADEVICPICHRNVWFDGEGPCEHLVADWADDPWDNGGGVLGEGITEGLEGAEDLAVNARALALSLWSTGETRVPQRVEIADGVLSNHSWWPPLRAEILDQAPETGLADEEEKVDLARYAGPSVEKIAESLSGVTLTRETLGGMTSGTSVFIWSDDADAARSRIQAEIATASRALQSALALVEGDNER